MELFSDSGSIVENFKERINKLVFDYSLNHGGFRKTYKIQRDRVYYMLGDAHHANLSGKCLMLYNSEKDIFEGLGFKVKGSRINVSKTQILRNYEINFETIIGVEPNGLKTISTAKDVKKLYDIYSYKSSLHPFDDFMAHCINRWGMSIPASLERIIKSEIIKVRSGVLNRNSELYNYIPTVDASFSEMSRGPANVILTDGKLVPDGTCFGPILSKSVEDPRLKNEFRSKGLIMVHDYFILIGESPGPHYKKYTKMTKDNTIFWDPRRTDHKFNNVVSYFKKENIRDVVEYTTDALNRGLKPLVLIDIRKDKPKNLNTPEGAIEWERMVHDDNNLIIDMVNALDKRVTVCAKLRPAFMQVGSMRKLLRPVRILPLPYLRRSTAEFNMFVPNEALMNGNEIYDVTYDDLVRMSSEVFVLKNIIGGLYNMYLKDMHLNLGVVNKSVSLSDGSSAIWSLSNINNERISNFNFNNFLYAAPYSDFATSSVKRHFKGRNYSDWCLNILDEVNLKDGVYLVPLYAIVGGGQITSHDFVNAIITDQEQLIDFTQSERALSTQVVKLVSFILKDSFTAKGLNWTEIDNEIRNRRLSSLSGVGFTVTKMLDGKVLVDGKVVTVSGHMLYILLGSILGLPYGIKKYLKEIELNILKPGSSYERGVGGRVWHGLISHYLAVDCVIDVIDEYMVCTYEDRSKLNVVLRYVKSKLLELGSKYDVYLSVDERLVL
ncbi:VP3 [Banna virus strain JKT-6423]|uniref:Viral guanylyltransferase VP3 n=1 Tax=Banna virus TaxID=77763 RepID=VP3_BANNV|nr:VP3 [Banna virus strain JKT-6423]Q9INI4.1 RecName: Full=Viral guanylyltransferase VP3; AltName: Full=Virion protein 3; Short=VP3; Includes: RecName: Full=mRNA guanylyltransferase; Includes: RecName: Full=mRNA (guanine-N(7))-methyltransferase [Banna virus strain JKT-6423]AAF78856.1 VP3 [Banna virus]